MLKDRVAELRAGHLPADPASRTSYAAGEVAQCDFLFPDITLPVGFGQVRTANQLPVLTMVTGYSRWLSAVLVPSRAHEELLAGWWQLISALEAVPRLLVWDGEGAVGQYRRGDSRLTADCQAFRGTLATRGLVHPARMTTAESPGKSVRAARQEVASAGDTATTPTHEGQELALVPEIRTLGTPFRRSTPRAPRPTVTPSRLCPVRPTPCRRPPPAGAACATSRPANNYICNWATPDPAATRSS